jgi:hypothetical protein
MEEQQQQQQHRQHTQHSAPRGASAFLLGRRTVRVGKCHDWPAGLPLLHPGATRAQVAAQVHPRANKSLVNTYQASFTGSEVLRGIASAAELTLLEEHAASVLDYLEAVDVIERVGRSQSLFSNRATRLYRLAEPAADAVVGALVVHVCSATGLLAENISGTSNPFVAVQAGDQVCLTKVVQRDLNPSWSETFLFPLHSAGEADAATSDAADGSSPGKLELTFEVFAHRRSKARTGIGATNAVDVDSGVPKVRRAAPQRLGVEQVPSLTLPLVRAANHGGAELGADAGTRQRRAAGQKRARQQQQQQQQQHGAERPNEELFYDDDDDDNDDHDNEAAEGSAAAALMSREDGPSLGSAADPGAAGTASSRKRGNIKVRVVMLAAETIRSALSTYPSECAAPAMAETGHLPQSESSPRSAGGGGGGGDDDDDDGSAADPVGEPAAAAQAGTSTSDDQRNHSRARPLSHMFFPLVKRFTSGGGKGDNAASGSGAPSPSPSATGAATGAATAPAAALGVSRDVLFAKEKHASLEVVAERVAAVEQALRDYGERCESGHVGTLHSPSLQRISSVVGGGHGPGAIDMLAASAFEPVDVSQKEDAEVQRTVRCLLFDIGAEGAFALMSGGRDSVSRSLWLRLAPLLSPLCHALSAHALYDMLLQAQEGERRSRAYEMAGQLDCLRLPAFKAYVRALYEECYQLELQRRRALADFSELALALREHPGEHIVRVLDRVRGGREKESAIRKSQYGGRLIVTTHALYFGKKHVFHSNKITQRDDLSEGVQVLESNGTMDFGLMVGYKTAARAGPHPGAGDDAVDAVDEGDEDAAEGQGALEQLSPELMTRRGGAPEGPWQSLEEDSGHARPPSEADRARMLDRLEGLLSGSDSDESEEEGEEGKGGSAGGLRPHHRDASPTRPQSLPPPKRSASSPVSPAGSSSGAGAGAGAGAGTRVSNLSAGAVKTKVAPFELKHRPVHIARYSVFRFPLQNNSQARDLNMVLMRAIIAHNLFCELVLQPVLESDVASLRALLPRPGGAAAPAPTMSAFVDKARARAREVLVQELTTFRALVKMAQRGDTRVKWAWLGAVDTFETFGDAWSWRRRTPLALLALVSAALQPESKRCSRTRRLASDCLLQLALTTACEAAAALGASVEWAPRPRLVPPSALERERPPRAGLQFQLWARHPEHACPACEHQQSRFVPAAAGPGPAPDAHDDKLSDALDKVWMDHALARQADLVRSATKLESMGQNVALLMAILEPVREAADDATLIFRAVITWEQPHQTALLGATSLVLIVSGWTTYAPGLLACAAAWGLLELRALRRKMGFRKLYIPEKQAKSLLRKYKEIKSKCESWLAGWLAWRCCRYRNRPHDGRDCSPAWYGPFHCASN